ncbi:MAG: isocitrate/isopropylmalate dehydrogenase family protein [Candidatus Bathyarchaeum sp.]|nr:MAG: isocitrate/isopropylmalate dehydrogenase family protein [Candidatus Bathyarchaeum sp.]
MTTYKLAVIPGPGIGKEVVPEAVRLLESTDLKFDCSYMEVGYEVFKKTGTPVPDDVLARMRKTQACLFGATATPVGVPGYKSAIITLRRALGLYANVRPAKSYPSQRGMKDVDLVIVRENTEGLYSGMEFELADSAYSIRVITRKATERIARFAFDLAMKRQKKVTVVTKANVLRKSDGLFLEVSRKVAEDYPEVEVEEAFVDVTAMRLILKPHIFDVIVTSNLFGDILSDEAAGLVGGLGLAPSANIGADFALFEPVHGSAPRLAGKGIANPMAAILASRMMLDYLGESKWAERVENAVVTVLKEGKSLTPDLGGSSSTTEVTDAIIKALKKS